MHCSMMISRRSFLAHSLAAGVIGSSARADEANRRHAQADRALVAISLDLEMSRNFPTWETTHWDYEKGNLNEETKKYTVEACRRVKEQGGVLHCFVVGRTLEQENVDWLKSIAQAGHPLGNHTYDHVNILATTPANVQYRFQRAPWLLEGRSVADAIRDNVRLANLALRSRIGVDVAGFRTPGGFSNGLTGREDVQRMLLDLGFTWASAHSPNYLMKRGQEPDQAVLDAIVQAQASAQPYVYPSGLIEVPMSPISDIGAFRTGRWSLDSFLKAIRLGLEWCIERRAVYDFISHPSCLYVVDPQFKAIDLICDIVRKAGDRAALVEVGALAQRARR